MNKKVTKEVTKALLTSLKLKEEINQIDAKISFMAEEATASHPLHQKFLQLREHLHQLEDEREKVAECLKKHGIRVA